MNGKEEKEIVNVRCRSGFSRTRGTPGSNYDYTMTRCSSETAYVINRSSNSITLRCTQCGFSWTINTGGKF